MAIRIGKAQWSGTLKDGKGEMHITDHSSPYNYSTRFEEGAGTNPEEFVGAAHAGCYSMFLSALISGQKLTPESINTTATVTIDKDDIGPNITSIKLECVVVCEGLSQEIFKELSLAAKAKCPISRLYEGGSAVIELDAKLN